MASPADNLLRTGRGTVSRVDTPDLLPTDQQATAAGSAAHVLRNLPTAGAPQSPAKSVAGRIGQSMRDPTKLAKMGSSVAILPEGLRTGNVFTHPDATWNDVGTQAAEGFGRYGSAGAGAALGATLGSVLGPVGTLVGGLGGGAFGYFAGDQAIKGLRQAVGVDPRSPDERLGARAPGAAALRLPIAPPAAAAAPAAPQAGYRDEGRNYPLATTASELRAPNLDGKIVRNGNSYSGSNIEFGADIVDPQGRLVNGGDPNKPKGFGVTSLDTSAGHQANLRELASLRAEAAERAAGFAANQPGGGLTGMSTRSLVDDVVARHGTRGASAEAGLSARQRANLRMQEAELAQRGSIAGMQNAATLRGQDIGADTSRYGVDTGAATARRGQDMDYREKIDARMMDLMAKQQLRGASAEAFKRFGGDMRKFAAWQAANGMSPDGALSVQKYGDERAAAKDKAIDRIAESLSVVDGKIDPAAVSANRVRVKKNNAVAGASPDDVLANEAQITDRQRLLNSANALRDVGWGHTLGLSNPSPEYGAMPDLRGGVAEPVGFFEGMLTGNNVERGDFKIKRPGADPIFLKREGLDEAAIKQLETDYGVKLPR